MESWKIAINGKYHEISISIDHHTQKCNYSPRALKCIWQRRYTCPIMGPWACGALSALRHLSPKSRPFETSVSSKMHEEISCLLCCSSDVHSKAGNPQVREVLYFFLRCSNFRVQFFWEDVRNLSVQFYIENRWKQGVQGPASQSMLQYWMILVSTFRLQSSESQISRSQDFIGFYEYGACLGYYMLLWYYLYYLSTATYNILLYVI